MSRQLLSLGVALALITLSPAHADQGAEFDVTCPAASGFGQAPTDPTAVSGIPARESFGDRVRVFEFFPELDGQIVAVRWWGTYYDFSAGETGAPCAPATPTIDLRFWNENNGAPGANVAAFRDDLTGSEVLELDGQKYIEYNAPLPEPVRLRSGWVSVRGFDRFDADAACSFLWMRSPVGDGVAIQEDLATDVRELITENLAICLVTEPFPEGEAGPEEGEGEGEAASTEGEAEPLEGEPEAEAEPEIDPEVLRMLLLEFVTADTDGDGRLLLSEIRTIVATFDINDLDLLDRDRNEQLSPWEIIEYRGEGVLHRADSNGDRVVDLTELLRVVQLLNALGYDCAPVGDATEDGYVPAPGLTKGETPACRPHTADIDDDRGIALSEILRVVQFYNAQAYYDCDEDTEDGFCPGTP